jgi:threonine aldolase
VALDSMVDRLYEDHENAKKIALGISDINGIDIDTDYVKTNIIRFSLKNKASSLNNFKMNLMENGVLANSSGDLIRMVTHNDINSDDVSVVLKAISMSL